MRRLLLLITTSALLAFGACSPTAPETVEPPASPVTSPPVSPSVSQGPSAQESSTPTASQDTDDDSVEEQGDESDDETSFADAYSYSDGVKVEVTKIRHGTRGKKGAWVQLTVRVTNGSKKRMAEPVGDFELSYGPDKDVADPISVPGVRNRDLSGSIAPGKANTTSASFSVPVKDQDDVVLGFTPDISHDTAYFSGSIV